MKLMVAVPTTDYVHAEFMKCLVKLSMHLAKCGVDVDVHIVGGTLVYIARNRLAGRAISLGYTHVLWLDSDMRTSWTTCCSAGRTWCAARLSAGGRHTAHVFTLTFLTRRT